MSATQVQVPGRSVGAAPPIRHLYRAPSATGPRKGDRAVCGHVLGAEPTKRRFRAVTPEHCVVCLEMARESGWL